MSAYGGFGMSIDFAGQADHRPLHLSSHSSIAGRSLQRLPHEIGRGTVELVMLGTRVAYAQGQCRDAPAEARAHITPLEDCFQFVFHLAPTPVRLELAECSEPLHLMRSDSLLLGPTICGALMLQPDQSVHEVALFAAAGMIEACFADAECRIPAAVSAALGDPRGKPLIDLGNSTAGIGLALRQLLSCPLNGGIARVYLEAKVMEIVSLRLAQLDDSITVSRQPKFLRGDPELLEYARHILMTEYCNPPTIGELANSVGLSRTRLIAGFRKRFGTTVFAFLRSQRMQHALQLLRDGNCNVTEAAGLVGYNSLSAFSAAFKTEFGFCPRSARGTHRSVHPTSLRQVDLIEVRLEPEEGQP